MKEILLNNRNNDVDLMENCFRWLTNWKESPVQVVDEALCIYLQITPMLTFVNHCNGNSNSSTKCHLCNGDSESVRHLLSSCNKFLNTAYKRRHDRVLLQYIIFKFLGKYHLVQFIHPWYTKVVIKPQYENDIVVLWDIPEYPGYVLRPDGNIIFKTQRIIYVLEMLIPWITNHESNIDEKVEKYVNQSLKVDNHLFKLQKLTVLVVIQSRLLKH